MALQAPPRKSSFRAWLWLPATALIVLAAGWGWYSFQHHAAVAQLAPPAAPVHAAVVERKDFPIVLTGLGTVQPANIVTVRSRVDGIEKVAFEEGQIVKEGDLLVQIDPAPFKATLDQAKAKLAQDQATLNNNKQDLQRTATLAKQGDATLQLLDQRTATVANMTALVQADEAAIESANVQLAYTTIKSPLTGRAGFRLVDPGNIVHANDQAGVLTITQLQPISVVFTAPEQRLPEISDALKEGAPEMTALSSEGNKVLAEGALRLIDNQVDVASGTIKLKADFENKDNALWPGQSVTTRLLFKTVKDVVVVPDTAVQRGPNGLFAYVVTADNTAELMVDFAITAEREHHLSPVEAIRRAALLRFRPIMMTTMAAMLGGIPLMLGAGNGAEIRQPLGYAMVGGLLVSQVLTLFTTPVIYVYLDRLSNYLTGASEEVEAHDVPVQRAAAAE